MLIACFHANEQPIINDLLCTRKSRKKLDITHRWAYSLLNLSRPTRADFGVPYISLVRFLISDAVSQKLTFPCIIENAHINEEVVRLFIFYFITRNYRIGLAQADGRNWDLKISNINTDPMRYQEAYIEVVVPPDIIYSESSTDTIIREGSNVSLTCAGSGYPQPHILWRREDSASITRGKLKSNSFDGEVLVLPRVSRLHIGAYLCIASNIAPVLWIPNQLEGTVVGQQVSLVCQIEAFPIPIVYWTTENGEIIIDNSRFTMTVTLENEYKMTMTLNIQVPAVPRAPVDLDPPYDSEMDDSQSDNALLKICGNQHTPLFRPSSLRPSSARPSSRLRFVVAPSSPRPSPRHRLARHPVFASHVAPSSPRGRPVITSPAGPSSPRGRPVVAVIIMVSLYCVVCC
ncbi:hypothetical protein GHT06_017933 [Daphnia sinensis]|uniref:Ig-like domain-containing protein n=1 Tax=Daphnia sinensis TaxID=1820382 RepID=A0AAD5PRW9_9CRUS|nr:hypothetical protein GHT06_017933 [Daphnia sinensis]